MQKDQKGYYIFATKEELNPENNNLATFIGAMTGGIIGGIVGGIIDANTRKNKLEEQDGFYNIYIDSLIGELLYEK